MARDVEALLRSAEAAVRRGVVWAALVCGSGRIGAARVGAHRGGACAGVAAERLVRRAMARAATQGCNNGVEAMGLVKDGLVPRASAARVAEAEANGVGSVETGVPATAAAVGQSSLNALPRSGGERWRMGFSALCVELRRGGMSVGDARVHWRALVAGFCRSRVVHCHA